MLKDKIKEPSEDDLNLASEIVRAKLKLQHRSCDSYYYKVLIEETLKQIEVSKATISICKAVIY